MTVHTRAAEKPSRLSPGKLLLALRILSVLSVLNVIYQGTTAGQLLIRVRGSLELHAIGAIVLHVLTGLTMIAAALLWFSARTSLWPSVIAVLVFIATFCQAALGQESTLFVHVPLALGILLGAAWLMTWAWMQPMSSGRHEATPTHRR